MKKFVAIVPCLVLAVVVAGCGKVIYRIGITIPSDSTDSFAWSDEEISPNSRKITIHSCDEMGDAEIILKPVEVKEENAYDEPIVIASGKYVTLNAEKGAWFKIGIRILDNAVPDKVKYFEIKDIEVRIAFEPVGERMEICVDNVLYANTETEVPIEPDESTIEYVEIPVGGGSTISAFARIQDGGENYLVCLIGEKWYKFIAE